MMKKDLVEELFNIHYGEAKLYIYSLCKNSALSEDIAADSFYKAAQTCPDGVVFKYWYLKMCRNRYLDGLKRSKRNCRLTENIPEDDETVIEKLIRREEYAALYKAIGLLPENYREAIELFYFQYLKIEEIALLIDKTIDNVKVILYRGRIKLKELLNREEV